MSRRATSWKLATLLALGALTQGCASFAWPTSGAATALKKTNTAPVSPLASVKSKVASWFSNKPPDPHRIDPNDPRDAALSVNNKAKPSPDLNVAMARMFEQSQKFSDAESQYNQALKLDAKYLPALVGLARLQDQQAHWDDAIASYRKAIALSPQDGRLQNDLGLCLHRRGNLPEAATALEQAVRLQPDRALYRNNLATVLIDMNRPEAALEQLIAASGPAKGHYNLGFLLLRKGNQRGALMEFRAAATIDPTCEPAQQWLAKLEGSQDGSTLVAAQNKPSTSLPHWMHPADSGAPAVSQPANAGPGQSAPPTVVPPQPAPPQPAAPGGSEMQYPRQPNYSSAAAEAPLPANYGGGPTGSGSGPTSYGPASNMAPAAPAASPTAPATPSGGENTLEAPAAAASDDPAVDAASGPQLGPSARRLKQSRTR